MITKNTTFYTKKSKADYHKKKREGLRAPLFFLYPMIYLLFGINEINFTAK